MQITFNRSMMDGKTEPTDGHAFLVFQEACAFAFVAHAIEGGYAISHLRSGRRVESCTATVTEPVTLGDAISGFRAKVDTGAIELTYVEEKASRFPVVNPAWRLTVKQRSQGVREFTEMSTVHLPPEDLQVIGNLIDSEEWESGFSGSTGVLLWRGYKDSQFCPEALRTILADLDTDYVLFEPAAPTHPPFPEFAEFWD